METCGTARVTRIVGTQAEVVLERSSACGHCHASDLCDAFSNRSVVHVLVENPLKARIGQVVELGSERSLGLRAAFMVYLLPALFFVTGIVVGVETFHWPPWGGGLLGLGLLGISWFLAWRFDRHASGQKQYRLGITRILASAPEADTRQEESGRPAPLETP